MADHDIATKAPESDAQENVISPASAAEQSPFPGDTPAQTGPTMGVCCVFRAPGIPILTDIGPLHIG